jgi:hypothetical protein
MQPYYVIKKPKTDRTLPNNKPDFMIRDNENGICMLIEAAISEQECDKERS